jgi:hypothetical protein
MGLFGFSLSTLFGQTPKTSMKRSTSNKRHATRRRNPRKKGSFRKKNNKRVTRKYKMRGG